MNECKWMKEGIDKRMNKLINGWMELKESMYEWKWMKEWKYRNEWMIENAGTNEYERMDERMNEWIVKTKYCA